MDYLEANISNLEIYTDDNWLYITVDNDNKQILHMGTTKIHPVAHLQNQVTEGLLIINENLPLKLYAFTIPKTINKEVIKKMVTNELEQSFLDIGDDFQGKTLDVERWKKHSDYSKEILVSINSILSN